MIRDVNTCFDHEGRADSGGGVACELFGRKFESHCFSVSLKWNSRRGHHSVPDGKLYRQSPSLPVSQSANQKGI
jgi:hypothetical protein